MQISRASIAIALADAERTSMRRHYAAHRWVRFPGILSPTLLDAIQRRLDTAEFIRTVHDCVSPPSIDLSMVPNEAAGLLELLFNDPRLWRIVQDVTGCAPIARFGGFVYRLEPAVGLHHNWHSDAIDDRLLAMSVNIGRDPYEGGELFLRDAASGAIVGSAANVRAGDAVIFQIDRGLEHRVVPVTRGSKTAFAGWFCGGESYAARLRRRACAAAGAP